MGHPGHGHGLIGGLQRMDQSDDEGVLLPSGDTDIIMLEMCIYYIYMHVNDYILYDYIYILYICDILCI